jgi:hypothetical protein
LATPQSRVLAAQYEEMLETSEPSVNNQDVIENGWGAEI